MSFGLGVSTSVSVASFGQPVGIDSVLMDQLYKFSTKDVVPLAELKNNNTRGERNWKSPNRSCYGNAGVVGLHLERILNLNGMGRPAIACDSHVRVVESGRAGS